MSNLPKLHFRTAVALTAAIAVEEVILPEGIPIGGSRFTVPAGETTPVEKHHPVEMWLVRSGCGELSYEGRKLKIEGGEVIYLASNASHSVYNCGSQGLDIFSIWLLDGPYRPSDPA